MTITTNDDAAGEYVLDTSWHAERERLDSMTALYDPGTLAICDRLGLAPGWRCLDVGAGTGTLAQALAERVAPSGTVVRRRHQHAVSRAAGRAARGARGPRRDRGGAAAGRV